jgi:nucleoside-diphosphate-sugar epimerase
MKVFVTGATGWVGSAVIQELLAQATRCWAWPARMKERKRWHARGIAVHRGELSDLDSMVAGARACDGVIHTAFIHDFKDFNAAGETDRAAIAAMGDALAGTGKPLVTTSASALLKHGVTGSENDGPDPQGPAQHRTASEAQTLSLVERGVRATLVRLPPSVHGDGDYGFVPRLVDIARAKGMSAYIGEGRTAGRRCTASTRRGYIAWRWNLASPASAIMPSANKASPRAISRRLSARD